ncbi:unnamed protein product, partial [Discosporangium mesarthrocarpum]
RILRVRARFAQNKALLAGKEEATGEGKGGSRPRAGGDTKDIYPKDCLLQVSAHAGEGMFRDMKHFCLPPPSPAAASTSASTTAGEPSGGGHGGRGRGGVAAEGEEEGGERAQGTAAEGGVMKHPSPRGGPGSESVG